MMSKRKIKNTVKLTLGIVPLIFIVYLTVIPFFVIIKKDIMAKDMYVISSYVNIRTGPEKDALKMGKVNFGTKVLVYKIENAWAEVLIEGQKGFIHESFLGKPKIFFKIDGLFHDEKSMKLLPKLKYKLSIINYLDSMGYLPNIKKEYKEHFDENDLKKDRFQFLSVKRGSSYKTTAFSDFDGDFVWDAAIILKNINTKANHLVILTFDKKDPEINNKAIFSMDLEENYYYIKRVKKWNRRYLYNKEGEKVKQSLKIAAIEIGTNRNRNLNDTKYLLVYNGSKFEYIDQNQPEN